MKKLVVCALAISALSLYADATKAVVQPDSRPCPQWWKDAKFGIFIHWGVYSVPAFAPTSGEKMNSCYAEQYRGKIQNKVKSVVEHHEKRYPGLSYEDLASRFTAENWNPDDWAKLFRRSGAKYVVLTSKHHDGFALWPSEQSRYWNSMAVGPKRDICGELTKAVKDAGLKMGFYYSLFEYSVITTDLGKVTKRFVDEMNIPQLKDLVLRYRPDIVWGDGQWRVLEEISRGKEFLTWLYNESPVRDTVVANDRWWHRSRGQCGDFYTTEYDHAGLKPNKKKDHPWEECRGIGRSFGYNRFERAENYLTDAKCIETLCDKVSRGGSLLLNVGPDATGFIPPIMEERLLAMGKWLEVNGEAIYGTTAWSGRPKDMKKDRVYYTEKPDALYAICAVWPQTKFRVKGVGAVSKVTLLGSGLEVAFESDGDDVVITPPAVNPGNMPCSHAWTFKLSRGVETAHAERPIGVFDSGIGGMTVLESIMSMDRYDNESGERKSDGRPDFEGEKFVYFGDQANMPYGDYAAAGKSEYLKKLIGADADFLLSKKSKAVVIACNTATAWGFEDVSKKGEKENVPVVGVIGAGVRSALSLNDVASAEGAISIGVMATPGTIASGAYERMILAEAKKLGLKASIKVFSQGCAGLADAVEAGSPKANEIVLANYRELIKKHSADTAAGPLKAVILGCTHYPFVLSALKKEASSVVFVDPAAATAEECYLNLRNGRLLRRRGRIALSAFISVPASGLDRRFLDDRGNLSRQCKYSRELDDETRWTEIRPYLASDASGNRFIRSSLPLTWSLLAEAEITVR